MAENPLIGKRISLISKKNIRYLGTLYSINEQNATVALQNVRSYGTEGREVAEGLAPVEPSDAVHPFLLFRGQDIKDLHVHDEGSASSTNDAEDGKTDGGAKTEATSAQPTPAQAPKPTQKAPKTAAAPADKKPAAKQPSAASPTPKENKQQQPKQNNKPKGSDGNNKNSNNTANNNSNNNKRRQQRAAVGTGASLLNRKARGTDGEAPETLAVPKEDFDFEKSNLSDEDEDDNHDDSEAGDEPATNANMAYEKNDFFDSISCDATDRASGIDNRLRGGQERNLNKETFGATALNTNNYYRRRGGGGGRGRGGRGGRGRGGRRGRGYRGNNNNSSNRQGSGAGQQQNRYSATSASS